MTKRRNNARNAAKAKLLQAQKDLTEYVIKNLQTGVSWSKCWASLDNGIPQSVTTGKRYKGANVFLLAMTAMVMGYDSSQWGTFKAWKEKGYSVQKGEKGTAIVFYKPIFETCPDTGEKKFKCAILKYSNVFNRSQTDAPSDIDVPDHVACEGDAGDLMYAYIRNAGIKMINRNRACYSPVKDQITLPKKYTSKSRGWAVVAHEIIHSTGHKDRLDRDGVARFKNWGDHQYSFEELVAELGSIFLCSSLGLTNEESQEQSAAYISHWASKLQDQPDMIWKAATEASKAVEYVMKVATEKEEAAAA